MWKDQQAAREGGNLHGKHLAAAEQKEQKRKKRKERIVKAFGTPPQ